MYSLKKVSTPVILGLLTFLLLIIASDYPFITTGEPREAVVAQSMVLKRDLLHSVRYLDDYATKPPLTHWLMVLGSKLSGGMNEFTSRLPSIISASFIVFIWSLFLLPRLGKDKTIFATLTLLSSFEWLRNASLARVDMILSACQLSVLLLLFLFYEKKDQRYLFFCFLPLVFGTLTKGPVALILPLAAFFVFLLLNSRINKALIFKLFSLSILSLLPLLFWYYLQAKQFGSSTFDIVIGENFSRFLSKMNNGENPHSHGLFYMPSVLLGGLLPFSPFLLFIFKYLYKLKPTSVLASFKNSDDYIQYFIIIALVYFIFFQIPSSKRGVYLLPIYPMLSLFFSLFINKALLEIVSFRRVLIVSCSILVSLWALGLVIVGLKTELFGLLAKYASVAEYFHTTYLENLLVFALFSLIPILVLLFSLKFLTKNNIKYLLPMSFLSIFVCAKVIYVSPYANFISPRDFVFKELKERQPSELSLYSIRMYGVLFYSRVINPKIELKESSDNIFAWEKEDLSSLENISYVRKSERPVQKFSRHLKYLELN